MSIQDNKAEWDRLFSEWINSGKRKFDFLKSKGINPRSMPTKKATMTWEADAVALAKSLKKNYFDHRKDIAETLAEPPIDEAALGDDLSKAKDSPLKHEIRDFDQKTVKKFAHPQIAIQEIWQIVAQWRQQQSQNDYKFADAIRKHCQLILKENLAIESDKFGNRITKSLLKTSDLSNLAAVAERIQKIQRLALGLSTENIGIDNIRETIEDDIPVFEVQMSSNGKFVKVRA